MFCKRIRLLKCSFCKIRQQHTAQKSTQSTAEFCLQSVKRTDYEHYLSNLFLPEKLRSHAFAIRAFNSEIAGVRDSVSDKTIGLMRFNFWRSTIDKLYEGEVPQHPVAIELYKTIKQHDVPKKLFYRLIEAREHFISDVPFESLQQAEEYGDLAFGSVYLILLNILQNQSGHLKHAVQSLGKLEGVLTLLRAAPYHLRQRRVLLPTDLLMERDLSAEEIMRNPVDNEPLREVVEIIGSRAQEHLNNARFRMGYILPTSDRLLLLPAVSADQYLDKLSKCDCNVFDAKLNRRNSMLPLLLYWNKCRNKY